MKDNNLINYSASFELDEDEKLLFTKLLLTSVLDNPGYNGVTLLLFNSLGRDITKLLKAVIADKHSKRQVFSSDYYKKLTTIIKEAIIISEVKRNTEPDGFVSVETLAKSHRFMVLNMDRNMIHRTLKKYDIKYQKRKYEKRLNTPKQ